MSVIKEFQEFALKGNAIDLAIGVVIGSAFGKITTSLVEDIINPIIGFLFGNIDFSDKVLQLSEAVSIKYGSLITVIINFILVGFALFILVKQINILKKKLKQEEEKSEHTPQPVPEDIALLKEIRDLLKQK